MMKSPFEFTWTLPEFDGVGLIRDAELSQFAENCSRMNLEGISIAIKDFLSCVNRVSYDNNLGDIVDGASLIYTTSDSKQLHLHGCYEGSMVNCFDQQSIS